MGALLNGVSYFDAVPVLAEAGPVMRRLGYRKDQTRLSEQDEAFFTRGRSLGVSLCANRGAAGRFPVASVTEERVVLANGTVFESALLAKLLAQSREVLLMAGTAGAGITERIQAEMASGNAALSVVLDAVGSIAADGILDWLMDCYGKVLAREGLKLTKHRYSPGYGDLDLSNQVSIFGLLGLTRLELTLTDTMILTPEKSVLAIAGIEGA